LKAIVSNFHQTRTIAPLLRTIEPDDRTSIANKHR